MVVRQPSERISASFRPTVNVPVFGFVAAQEEDQGAMSVPTDFECGMSVPNCMLALHVRTNEQGQRHRLVAFAGREASVQGATDANCVWVMKLFTKSGTAVETEGGGSGSSGNSGNSGRSREDDRSEQVDDGASRSTSSHKRGRNELEEQEPARKSTTGLDNVWSIGCIPLPIGHSVVAMDFYGGGEDEEWLVVLMSTVDGDSIVGLFNDQHEHIQYQDIGIDLSLGLPPTTTLVQLASAAGLVRNPSLYEKILVTSDVIANTQPSSLDVCASRGIITVCTDGRTLHLYAPDVDEDSEEEEEEEEEEAE